MKKALLINGYETFEGVGQNRLNRSLIEITKQILEDKGYEVKVTEVEKGYDVSQEVEKHLWADVVFVQTPIYWFNVPGAFKTYIDKVYISGYAEGCMCIGDGRTRDDASKKYGSGGLLKDKSYMISTTWNAPKEAFNDPDEFMDGMSLDEATLYLHKTYQFLGMKKLPSTAIFDIFKHPDCSEQVETFKAHIKANF